MSLIWNLRRLDLEACWQQGFNGTGIGVGHLDTGVDVQHPALHNKVSSFVAFDADGAMMPNVSPQDSGHHGTHTAGIICGGTVEGQAIGIAPDARLCSGIVIEGGKSLLRVLCGLEWMLTQNVRVLCVSLGVPGYNRLFEIILGRLRQQGVLCVFPVGNSGRKTSCFPANYPGVMAVGAIAEDGSIARFSGSQSFNRELDPAKPNLVAPGVNILSAQPGGGLSLQDGTSMAAAHVAGVAALLFQAKPDATVEEVERALLTSCLPLPGVDRSLCGSGLINPIGAIEKLLGSPATQPHLIRR